MQNFFLDHAGVLPTIIECNLGRQTPKTIHPPFAPRLLEIDLEFVALDLGDRAVAGLSDDCLGPSRDKLRHGLTIARDRECFSGRYTAADFVPSASRFGH